MSTTPSAGIPPFPQQPGAQQAKTAQQRRRRRFTVSGILVLLAIVLSIAAIARPIGQKILDDNHRAELFTQAGSAAKIIAAAIAKQEFESTTGVFDPSLVTVTANRVEYAGQSVMTQETIRLYPGIGSIATEANMGRIDPETRAFCVQIGDGDLTAFYSNVGLSGVGTCASADEFASP